VSFIIIDRMDVRRSGGSHGRTVLARLALATLEDPFGPGDPLEVARLVRRTLAVAGRKAIDVSSLIVVADTATPTEALRGFVRRALGPHAGTVPAAVRMIDSANHDERVQRVLATPESAGPRLDLVIVLGPGAVATVLALGRVRR
jgi:hypothetical protein